MPKTYKITETEKDEIKEYRKKNKDKNVDKRIRAVELRGEGYKNKEIGAIVEANPKVISRWVSNYVKNGIKALQKGEYVGNHRNMTNEEERKFVEGYKERALKGEYVTVKEIKIAYNEKIGHKCGSGQIYRVMERQGWRKIVPRKEHPKKATETEIEATKKR